MLLKVERQFDQAIAAYARAIAAAPSDAQIRVNRAVALLHAGRWAEAWPDFEWRLHVKGAVTLPLEFLLPAVSEVGDLTGRTVLLTHEEGFGDTMQFLRYVPLLARRGARVLAWVPAPLVRLVRSGSGRGRGIHRRRRAAAIRFPLPVRQPAASVRNDGGDRSPRALSGSPIPR